jgi:hypothetical protein
VISAKFLQSIIFFASAVTHDHIRIVARASAEPAPLSKPAAAEDRGTLCGLTSHESAHKSTCFHAGAPILFARRFRRRCLVFEE